MSEPCPSLEALRAFAEDPSDEASLQASLEAHVASCPRCKKLVDLARREEAAIRQALPADVPRGLLEKTLQAIEAEEAGPGKTPSGGTPSRRRPSAAPRPGGARGAGWIVVALVGLAGFGLLLTHGTTPDPSSGPTSESSPPPTPAPSPVGPSPRAPSPRPTLAPSPEPSPAGTEPSPEATPENVPGPTPALPPVDPRPELTPGAPPAPTTSPSPGEVVASKGKTLARVRSGMLAAKGRAFTTGDALPEGETLEAQGTAAEVDGDGAVALVLAPRTRITVRAGTSGETVFAVAVGSRLLARTTGATHWALETPDARVTPLGTELALAVEAKLTRVSLLEGRARVEVEKAAAVEVRAGFEAEVTRARPPEAPHPFAAARAVGFLPEALRPKKLPPSSRVVRAHTFEDGLDGATRGEHVVTGGARGSRGCVRAARLGTDYAVVVEMDSTQSRLAPLALDPNLWVEATVKVSAKTKVVLQVWDTDAKENLAYFATVEPGQWTTLAVPLRSFGDANGAPRSKPVKTGDRSTCFSVFAGEPSETVELLLDDVRFSLEERQ